MSRSSKYNAVKTEIDGFLFASRREAIRYAELKMLEDAGEITDLELQPVFPCVINDKAICKYIADFRYTDTKTGKVVIEDAKGFKTDVYRIKKKMVQAIYNIVIVEV